MSGRIGLLVAGLLFAVQAQSQTSDLPIDGVVRGAAADLAPQRTALGIQSSTTSITQLVSFHVPLGERRSLGIGTELMKLASFYFRMGIYEEEPDWKFRAVPITLSYEHLLSAPHRRVVPVVGVGFSYYLTQLKARPDASSLASTVDAPLDNSPRPSLGMGWGAQATGGIRARITSGTFLQLQARYRLVDGLGVTAADRGDARFGVFDFVVGIGFSI